MLEKLEVLKKALDRGNKNGIFTLEESSVILTNYVQLKDFLQKEKELEENLLNKSSDE